MLDLSFLTEIASDASRALEPALAALGGEELAHALLGGMAGAALGLAALGRRRGAARGPGAAESAEGFALTLENGLLHASGRRARRFAGAEQVQAEGLLQRMTTLEGPPDLAAALRDLELDGRSFRLLADDERGRSWEVAGAPAGGEARLVFRAAGPARREVARLKAQLAARTEEAKALREALDDAPLLVWRRDRAGRLVWANRAYHELASPRGGADGAAPAELHVEAKSTGTASARRPPEGRRAVFDARTGERRFYEFSENEASDGGRLGYATDAAAAVHAEAALRRFVETLTETFAHLSIGLAVFDREMRLGLFNPAFAEMMRLEPAWLAARPTLTEVIEKLRENRRMPDMADLAGWRRKLAELFEAPGDDLGARPQRTEVWHLPGEEQIRVMARPHPQGAVAFLLEDISEAARLERRWLTETEMRRAVMDRLQEGVAAFGPDGTARFANPAFASLWGFRPGATGEAPRLSDALARFRALCTPDAEPAWDRLNAFFEITGPRKPWSEDLALQDGRRLRGRVAALPDGSVLTAFSDVSDAARAEAAGRELGLALQAAEELRGALIDQVSARVRTPLNTIFGYGQMLLDGAGDERPSLRQAAYADGILDAASEIQEAMSGVADLASAQEGALALAPSPVDLRAALLWALEQARRTAEARGVALTLEAVEGDDAVSGDAARVRQLLFNLIADAVHRAPAGAEVRAGARRCGGEIEIWTDEPAGPGADPDRPPELRGLAHALVRRFADLHGGSVRVEIALKADAADAMEGAPGAPERPLPFADVPAWAPRLRVACTLPAAALEEAEAAPRARFG